MKKLLPFFILCFLIVFPQLIVAQNKKPKVALVLSGGGAKGIAHIPTLQLLDSLGIVPDLIVGTSMGGIVGGLYAMGYSGDSLATITQSTNWDELFGGGVALQDVGVEEKSEFNRYLIEVDWKKGKPKLKSALLNDQNLREFLSLLTYPTYNINDFDNLSIPFRAVATDIVNGKEIILDEGSLSMALRATMSIPSIFRPVPYKNTLLVDGGVLNNFPSDIAKSMGADIIIGSDVGGGMAPIEKLDNIATLVFQAGMLSSNLKNPPNRELCDILIDNVPYITYSTGDFGKSNEIYEEGKIAAQLNKAALIALAEKLKKYNQRTHQLPKVPKTIKLDSILFNNVSEENLSLVRSRTNIKPFIAYKPEEIIEGIDRAMGTNLFDQITYNPLLIDGKKVLELNGFEKARHQSKASLHYDTFRGVGLFLNYTSRNVIGRASRFLFSLDIAEQPGLRIQYQKNFGKHKNWWWRSEFLGQRLLQNFYESGEKLDDLKYRYLTFDNQYNFNLNPLKSYVGVGLNYERTSLKPTADPEVVENPFFLNDYQFRNLEIYSHFRYNTMDKVFFPSKGTILDVKLSRSLVHNVDLDFYDIEIPDVKGKTNGFSKLVFNLEKRIPIHKKVTGIVTANTGFIFMDDLNSEDVSFVEFGFGGSYTLGGNLTRPRKDDYLFPGLNEGELIVTQFMMLNLGMQFNPTKSLYITPHFDIASVGFQEFDTYIKDAFSPSGNWKDLNETSLLTSGGLTLGYYSILGPITFDVSYVNRINKIRVFFGVGIQFNRSN
ncbi:MAG: patatin-like phospholipase family protein [Flavobacteriaceae bacterium]|nr:patatin-like phospholipase family protein [Flavobacteriaceae bacterium]